MSSRPPDVRIEDLAAPELPAHILEMAAAVEPLAGKCLTGADELLSQARAETGLSDAGDQRFREPLGVLVGALNDEAGLSPLGRVTAHAQLLQLLKNRLLVQDVLNRHPEIRDMPIERPIIVAGLPRTGTTHLHNLTSADPALRSLPYWEALEPVLADSERPPAGEPDPRLARTAQALDFVNGAMPYFERMHEMTVSHVHEEIQLLAIDFSTMLFETMAVMPSWRDWYKAADQTPTYRYLKTVLQVLQWSRGGTRWVLKSPQHLEQFGPLMATFPDATVVVTHRDPVSVTASLATMIAYTARLSHATVDTGRIGRYWADRVEDLLRACADDRDLLPADQSIDVRFGEFMADDVATVERIYELAGQPITAEARSAMDAFMATHPRGRHGRIRYDLADFGLDASERRAALTFYSARFQVEPEVTS